MCSILGVIHKDPKLGKSISEFIKINKSLNHRGPDDSGVCKIGNSIFGHNRLSIIGTKSKYSKQPINQNGFCQSFLNGRKAIQIIHDHYHGLKSYSYIIWLFLVLEAWHNVFIDTNYEFIQK